MNRKLIFLILGISLSFIGFSYMLNGLGLLFTDIDEYPEPIVLYIGVLIPVSIGSLFVGIGVFLVWKSYKFMM